MGGKKSEVRKHTATLRVTEEAKRQATFAASLSGKTLADWVSDLLMVHASSEVKRLARKLAGDK